MVFVFVISIRYGAQCLLLNAQCSMLMGCQLFTPNKYCYCHCYCCCCWFFVRKRREKKTQFSFYSFTFSNQPNVSMYGFCCTRDNFMSKSRQYLHIFHTDAAKILSHFRYLGCEFKLWIRTFGRKRLWGMY